jgi:nucleotide-binding universal stress UspA family protein
MLFFLTTQPLWVSGTILVGLTTVAATLMPSVIRRFVTLERLTANNEIAGFKFSAVGVLYAVLLAFAIIVVWQKFADSETTVAQEAGAAETIYRLSPDMGEKPRAELRAALMTYLKVAVADDWPAMDRDIEGASRATRQALDDVYKALLAFEPAQRGDVPLVSEIFHQLDVLTQARRVRLIAAEGIVPGVIWLVLFSGAALTITFTYFFGTENLRAQTIMTALFTILIFSELETIVVIDRPFSGPVKVGPGPLAEVLADFAAASGAAPAAASAPVAQRELVGHARARQNCAGEAAAGNSLNGHSAATCGTRMKTILVPTEHNSAMQSALDTALLLAQKFGGCIEGFPLRPAVADMVAMDPDAGLTMVAVKENDAQMVRQAAELFRSFMERHAVAQRADETPASPSWTWLDSAPSGHDFVGSYGRVFDAIVLARPGEEWQSPSMVTLESALFESGRPVLIAPPASPRSLGTNVLIAWNCSTEQARATAFAMPLLRLAERVTVLTVEGVTVAGPSGAEMARSLKLNGIAAEPITLPAGKRAAGEMILAKADELGCDLIVKGAYTQSRLRQMIFGGTTRHILAHAKLPVLMAH